MIDIVLLVVIGGSALLGLIRGLVGTLVSTAAWLLAGWASFQFGAETAVWLAEGGTPSASESFGGYALSFTVVMLSVVLIGVLAKTMVKSAGLSGFDRLLGTALGVVRGAFLACLLVLLMGFTPMPREPSWQQSRVLPMLLPGAGWMRSKLPDWSVPQMDFRKPPVAGDNARVENLPMPLLEGAVLQAIGSAKDRISQRSPTGDAGTGMDPANIETVAQDPADIESAGQDPADTESAKQRPNGQKRPKSQ